MSANSKIGTCPGCGKYAGQLIAVANRCCACGEYLIQGGWWGWHKEGFRAGPFCNDCTDKPNMGHQVSDPSVFLSHPADKKDGREHKEFLNGA